MKFTEAQLESAIIELLGAEDYPHVLGGTIERQPQEVRIKNPISLNILKNQNAVLSSESRQISRKFCHKKTLQIVTK